MKNDADSKCDSQFAFSAFPGYLHVPWTVALKNRNYITVFNQTNFTNLKYSNPEHPKVPISRFWLILPFIPFTCLCESSQQRLFGIKLAGHFRVTQTFAEQRLSIIFFTTEVIRSMEEVKYGDKRYKLGQECWNCDTWHLDLEAAIHIHTPRSNKGKLFWMSHSIFFTRTLKSSPNPGILRTSSLRKWLLVMINFLSYPEVKPTGE